MKTKYSIKQILLSNQTWWNFYQKHQDAVRHDILVCIVKLISCKNQVRGYREYTCSNINCSHKKIIPFTCKSKACSSCGKKATEVWLNKQKQILPNTSWQHITFTMPSILWDFFWHNRYLLNIIGALAVDCIKTITNKKRVKPGIFIAIHTFGRDLKRNVHIHLSTTNGGITATGDQWKKVFFHQDTLMKMWRYKIIDLFRKAIHNNELNIPPLVRGQFNHTFTFNDLLNQLYKQSWVVYCSKPTNNYKQIVEYLSRYIKRPTIAESKLRHYDGHSVTFRYLDHVTKKYKNFTLSVEEFIAKFIQHIPDIGFRMIRYYGFFSNRLRGQWLPKVYEVLKQLNPQPTTAPFYAELIKQNFGFDPLTCILCKCPLLLRRIVFGKSSTVLLRFHRELALLKKI